MTSPLDFPDLVSTLIVVWACALIVPLGEMATARYRARRPARPILLAVSRYVGFGSMLTIFGIAQTANSLGLISYGLYVFTILMAALAVACTGLAVRHAAPPRR